mgnify:CR=1 FL=1
MTDSDIAAKYSEKVEYLIASKNDYLKIINAMTKMFN